MFVKLTPQQARTYNLIWPNPGMRFTNELPDADWWRKWKWLYRTFGQSTGLTPPVVPEGWRHAPDIDARADELEQIARETGIDEQFNETTFIDTTPEVSEIKKQGTSSAFGMIAELQKTPVIIIILAVIAIILILYLLIK